MAAASAAFCIDRVLRYQLEISNPRPKVASTTGNSKPIMTATPPRWSCRRRVDERVISLITCRAGPLDMNAHPQFLQYFHIVQHHNTLAPLTKVFDGHH